MTIITSRLIYLPNASDILMTKMVMHNSVILKVEIDFVSVWKSFQIIELI